MELPSLQWTGTKRELLELVIALQDLGIIHNNRTHKSADLADLLKAAETLFPNISLKNYYAERREMRQRYTNTPFLDKLRLAFGKNSKI